MKTITRLCIPTTLALCVLAGQVASAQPLPESATPVQRVMAEYAIFDQSTGKIADPEQKRAVAVSWIERIEGAMRDPTQGDVNERQLARYTLGTLHEIASQPDRAAAMYQDLASDNGVHPSMRAESVLRALRLADQVGLDLPEKLNLLDTYDMVVDNAGGDDLSSPYTDARIISDMRRAEMYIAAGAQRQDVALVGRAAEFQRRYVEQLQTRADLRDNDFVKTLNFSLDASLLNLGRYTGQHADLLQARGDAPAAAAATESSLAALRGAIAAAPAGSFAQNASAEFIRRSLAGAVSREIAIQGIAEMFKSLQPGAESLNQLRTSMWDLLQEDPNGASTVSTSKSLAELSMRMHETWYGKEAAKSDNYLMSFLCMARCELNLGNAAQAAAWLEKLSALNPQAEYYGQAMRQITTEINNRFISIDAEATFIMKNIEDQPTLTGGAQTAESPAGTTTAQDATTTAAAASATTTSEAPAPQAPGTGVTPLAQSPSSLGTKHVILGLLGVAALGVLLLRLWTLRRRAGSRVLTRAAGDIS